MSDVQRNKALVQSFFDEVWNKGNFGYMDDVYTADFRLNALWENTSLGRSGTAAKDEARTTIEGWLDGFPDMRVTVEEQIAEGDYVASRHIAVGTQAREFRGLPNTGRRGAITGITINRVSGDRIAEVWTCWDAAGMMQQLGIFPGPDPELSSEETTSIWAALPSLPEPDGDVRAIVSRLYDEVWTGGDLAAADALVDDGYLGHASG
ncbi:MAG: ester cyclase, partial [Actinomycetes bacterium]